MANIKVSVIDLGRLSPKEAVILAYLCKGYMRKEIALRVCRTPSTVGKQIESIARKLDCHNAAEIVATAVGADMVKITITHEHSLFMKMICVLLMMNITSSHIDLRRAPRSPRPMRSMRTNARVARYQRRG